MCSESNLWEKLSKLKPNVFGSQTNCLSLSLERISSIFNIRNILNFSLWDWINGGTHILPQPEKRSDDIWNIGIKNGKDLYGKKESLRIVQFIFLRNNLIKFFYLHFSISHFPVYCCKTTLWVEEKVNVHWTLSFGRSSKWVFTKFEIELFKNFDQN